MKRFVSFTTAVLFLLVAAGGTLTTCTPEVQTLDILPFTVTVKGGTAADGDGNSVTKMEALRGAVIAITADPDSTDPNDKPFHHWSTDVDVRMTNPKKSDTEFIMPAANVIITANKGFLEVTVEGGTSAAAGSLKQGTSVTLNAGTPAAGDVFSHWTIYPTPAGFTNADSTTFTMPAEDVLAIANYKKISGGTPYTVTVGGSGVGGGSYEEGRTVNLIVPSFSTVNQVFIGWYSADAIAFENKGSLGSQGPQRASFVMPGKNVAVTGKSLYEVQEIMFKCSGAFAEYDALWSSRKGFYVDDGGYLAIGSDTPAARWMVMTEDSSFNKIEINTLKGQKKKLAFRNVGTGRYINSEGLSRPLTDMAQGNGQQIRVSEFKDKDEFYWGIANPDGQNDSGYDGWKQAFDANVYEWNKSPPNGDMGLWDIMGDHSLIKLKRGSGSAHLPAVLLHKCTLVPENWNPADDRFNHLVAVPSKNCGGGRHSWVNILFQ